MNNKIGWGSLSVVIFVFALLFSFNIGRTFCLGDVILEGLGLKAYSSGNGSGMHYTIIYSVALLAVGYIIGRIFPHDFAAKLGRRLCAVFAAITGFFLLFTIPAYVGFLSHFSQ